MYYSQSLHWNGWQEEEENDVSNYKKCRLGFLFTQMYVFWNVMSFLFSNLLFFLFESLSDFDRHELLIYEEVAKVPPFRRKTLVLIGAPGVGRRSLKNKLLVSDPQHYGTTVPCESSLGVSGMVFISVGVQMHSWCKYFFPLFWEIFGHNQNVVLIC